VVFHIWAKLFELNFSIRKTFSYICTRWVKSSSQLVNLIGAWFYNEAPCSMASISILHSVCHVLVIGTLWCGSCASLGQGEGEGGGSAIILIIPFLKNWDNHDKKIFPKCLFHKQ